MKFRNDTDKDRMIPIDEGRGVSRWITVKPGEEAELPKICKKYGLTEVIEAVESKIADVKVETKIKKKDIPSEKERLIEIKGVNEEIAEAILLRFGDIASAVEAGINGLMRVPAIGKTRAKKIIFALNNPSG